MNTPSEQPALQNASHANRPTPAWKTYHLLGASLEAWEMAESKLFAWSVKRVVDGFVDHLTYLELAHRFQERAAAGRRFDQRMTTLLAFDINPVADLFQTAADPASFETRWNGFNRTAPLGVETIVSHRPALSLRRLTRSTERNVRLRERVSTTCIAQLVPLRSKHAVRRHESRCRLGEQVRRLSAPRGSMEDIVAQLYAEPASSLRQCAIEIGCSIRTLQRELSSVGVNFGLLRQAVRLTTAGHLMRTEDHSLTEVSQLAGFFDSAHFIRAWKRACGITPSQYRGLI